MDEQIPKPITFEIQERYYLTNLLMRKLISLKNSKAVAKVLVENILNITASSTSAIFLINQKTNLIDIKSISTILDNPPSSFFRKTINDCQTLLLKKATLIEFNNYFKNRSTGNIICIPIIFDNTLLGFLVLINKNDNFYDENIQFMTMIAENLGLIIENISLYEESAMSNKLKLEFLAGISHEFKTPLNSIIGFVDILKERVSDKEILAPLENINKSSKHLLGLIQDILDVTKSGTKKMELEYSTFRTKAIILDIVAALNNISLEKGLNFSYTLLDCELAADVKRFKQVVFNFVSNAIKFNKESGKVNVLTYIENNNFIFEITDSGDGIAKKDQRKIFDFFTQTNSSYLKRQAGSGVGLALCKKIVDAHSGKIWFTSKIHKGSSFYFSLPIKP